MVEFLYVHLSTVFSSKSAMSMSRLEGEIKLFCTVDNATVRC